MLNLSPANINDTEYNIYGTSILGSSKEGFSGKKGKNKTIKNKAEKKNMMEKMQQLHDNLEDDNETMENFQVDQNRRKSSKT